MSTHELVQVWLFGFGAIVLSIPFAIILLTF